MPNSERDKVVRFAKKALGFVGVFVAVYLLILFLLGVFTPSHKNLILYLYDAGRPGGNSLERFREIEDYANVDVLFCGSSHAYRSFDPRIFKNEGLTSFNTGSSAQTPLNTYYLLKRYYEHLNPKLVILDVYFDLLEDEDGLESCFNLLTNTESSIEMVEMTIGTRNMTALNVMISLYGSRLVSPLSKWKPGDSKRSVYISGGYVETTLSTNPVSYEKSGSHTIKVSNRQMEYLKKCIKYITERNGRLLLIVQPMRKEYVKHYANYWEVTKEIKGISDTLGVSYIDFNEFLYLDSKTDFMDADHLNSRGVAIFNRYLIEELKERNLLE